MDEDARVQALIFAVFYRTALLFTVGFAHTLNNFRTGISSSGATITVALYVYAKEQGEFGVAFSIAVVQLILALIVNLGVTGVNYFFRKNGGHREK